MLNAQVAIIGGGLSGLYAARRLQQLGISYVLLEGRSELGGRIKALEIVPVAGHSSSLEPSKFDLGATWYWPSMQPQLQQLVEELGLKTFAQPQTGDWLLERTRATQPGRFAGYPASPTSMRLEGGMTALVKVLAAEVDPASIRLEHLVRSVRHNGAVVEVMAMREGEEVTFVVEQVLLALPPRLAARSIHFSPQLPPATLQAWTATPTWMAPHAKYLAVYPEPFWRELGLAGAAQSNAGPMVEIHDASSHDGPGALFGFIGVPAQSRASIGANELIAACRAQMVRLFGPGAQQPIADLVQDWAADPLTATALDQTAGGHALAPSATIADGKWIGRLVGTASEWSPEFPGYVAGAIDAADRAVDEIARFVGAPAEQAG